MFWGERDTHRSFRYTSVVTVGVAGGAEGMEEVVGVPPAGVVFYNIL